MTRLRRFVLTVSMCLALSLVAAQDPVPPPEKPASAVKIENFSGTVTVLSPEAFTVVRKSLGRDPVIKQFVFAPDTKIEGNLKTKMRVTVRYQQVPDALPKAVHIIVR